MQLLYHRKYTVAHMDTKTVKEKKFRKNNV